MPPLQTMLVRRGEIILEIWARPARGVRQAVIRVTLRGDGKGFVQGRVGLGCCTPRVGRLVAFNEDLPPDSIAAFRAVAEHAMWAQPRLTEVEDTIDTISPVCLDGVAWDLTLVTYGASRHLHRACLDEEVGSVADALTPALSAALGQDPRFDVVFPGRTDFNREKAVYDGLIARGGRLRPARANRAQPLAVPPPLDEPGSPDDTVGQPGGPP